MRYVYIIAKLFLITGIAFAQKGEQNKDTAKIVCEYGRAVILSKVGNTRIYFKDNTIKKHCIIKEIKEYWVVFMKDKSLHDVMIDKIKRIEFEDEMHAIYFDEKNKPMIKIMKTNTY